MGFYKDKGKTLFFKNLFRSYDGKEDGDWYHQATFILASAFRGNNLDFVISDIKLDTKNKEYGIDRVRELEDLLEREPGINLVVITLLEDCFTEARKLAAFVRARSKAFIAVGGIMPTLSPKHVMAHFDEVDFLVRGEGERALPQLAKSISGLWRGDGFDSGVEQRLRAIKGLYYRNGGQTAKSGDTGINYIENMDKIVLDFGLLNEDNLKEGLNLSTSRGCRNSCFFCTMPQKGRFRAISLPRLIGILEDYRKRLLELYADEKAIPASAFKLSFNDDDFLGDRERAIGFFEYLRISPFKINFIQAAVNSFFLYEDGHSTARLDRELINAMHSDIFYANPEGDKDRYSVYIGTENFSDKELGRLGKGYDYAKVESLVQALSERGIRQAHHLILTNIETELEDVFDNFEKIVLLRSRYPEYFNILLPLMPHLVSLYPSISYRLYGKKGLLGQVRTKSVLASETDPELDYPLVERDIPLDPDVLLLSENAGRIFDHSGGYESIFNKALDILLDKAEELRLRQIEIEQIEKLDRFLEKNKDYAERLRRLYAGRETGGIFRHDKNNLQLMLTRRCHLRCAYCPIPKKDADMDEAVLKKSIDILFDSYNKDVRVDFTGGEPLLRFDLMKKGIEYALKRSASTFKSVSFYIVTNALELSPEVIDFLDGKEVLLEISIDGDEFNHNRFKIPVEPNLNPYQLTTRNIRYLAGKAIRSYVVVVAAPETVVNLSKNLKHIFGLGIRHIEINYAIGRYWDQYSQSLFYSEIEKIAAEHREDILSGKIVLGNLGKRKEPAVLNGEFMVDTDGRIRPLNEFLLKSEERDQSPYDLGTVFDHARIEELYIDSFYVHYSLVRMFTRNNLELGRILRNNIEMGLDTAVFSARLAEEMGLSASDDKIRTSADILDFLSGPGELLPELGSDRPEVAALYGQVRRIFFRDEGLINKKIKALDRVLTSLIYSREGMLLSGYDKDIIEKYSGMIARYIDYPQLLAGANNMDLKDLPYCEDRLVVLVTHSCQLDCSYCSVKKYSAEMDEKTLFSAIDLLFSSSRYDLELQFFGGEPLLRLELVKAGVNYAKKRSAETAKNVKFILTTNGLALDAETAEYLKREDFTVELSLDGDMETQLMQRRSQGGQNYYDQVLGNMKNAIASGLDCYIISVVTPENAARLFDNFRFLITQGFKDIQINYALGTYWDSDAVNKFFQGLRRIMDYAEEHPEASRIINSLKNRREPVVLNAEVSVDTDGEVFLETGICLEEDFKKLKHDFSLGSLETLKDLKTVYNTRSRNLKALVDVYSREREEFRKIILNNVAMGVKLSRFFAIGKKGSAISAFDDDSSGDLAPRGSINKKRSSSDSLFHSLSPGFYLIYNMLFDYDVYEKEGECDNRCIFCSDAGKNVGNRGDNEAKRGMAVKKNLMLCAGEPANLPKILEVIEDLKATYSSISMTSNGRRLKDPDFARKLINSGISELGISLHGPKPQVHDAITGVNGSFEDTLEGIGNVITLLEKGYKNVSLTVNYVITLGNINYINEFVHMMADMGVEFLHFSPLLPMGRGRDIYGDQMADFKDILAKFRKLKEEEANARLKKMRIILSKVPYCAAEKYCPEIFGYMYYDVSEKHEEEGARHQDFCFGCRYGRYCEGVADEYVDVFGWPVSRQN